MTDVLRTNLPSYKRQPSGAPWQNNACCHGAPDGGICGHKLPSTVITLVDQMQVVNSVVMKYGVGGGGCAIHGSWPHLAGAVQVDVLVTTHL